MVTDEVYEHLVFDGAEHVPVATLPGMRERTLTISSAGKTFSTTGWKVGWVTGPAEAVAAVRAVKQFLTYVGSGPFQPAVAAGLGAAGCRVRRAGVVARRPSATGSSTGCGGAGMEVSVPRGHLLRRSRTPRRWVPLTPCRSATSCPARAGVVGVPVSVFHDDVDAARTLVRFAFCKRDDVLDEACRRLAALRV